MFYEETLSLNGIKILIELSSLQFFLFVIEITLSDYKVIINT